MCTHNCVRQWALTIVCSIGLQKTLSNESHGVDKPARLTIRLVLDLFLMVRRVWQPLWSGCKIFEGPPLSENSLNLTENNWLALPRTWRLVWSNLFSLIFITKCLKTALKARDPNIKHWAQTPKYIAPPVGHRKTWSYLILLFARNIKLLSTFLFGSNCNHKFWIV